MAACAVLRRQALWRFGMVHDILLDVKKRLSTNLTIVGAWNTAILTPEWVVQRVDWLKTDEKIPIEVSIGTPQNIRFRVHGVIVQPTSNRLDLIAEGESSQTYDLIARMATSIVERLPHTPIRAVGHNLSFDLDDGERFSAVSGTDLDSVQEQYRGIGGGDAVNEIQVKHAVESSRYTLNVTYGLTRENLVLDLNYHYPIVEGVDLAGILKEFPDNIHAGNELAEHLVETS